ncbi:exopolyphosphatase [Ginsengibacter hankyongi]|uniref:Exopolyphosphatase n=1 Tax=Ginsengibacter hankyongi TaxID=2607284 RepID=A0A5J5IBT4_9BACT|nr:exopolyphosphatase [Ginsengibacter hankyongi]KAA9034670.1 exopolyphosphatase [Ginsengibacter hankyongi]
MKLAAIDIGSNAARLLISEVSEDEKNKTTFNKVSLTRVPLRLGFDVFENGKISDYKRELLLYTMKAYINLLNAYEVKYLKACATSAMREAANSAEIISMVKKETGIEIEVISGSDEASFIYENHVAENLDKEHSYLYIDVGGGSTELTFFSNNKLVFKDSFNIGTIRLLKNKVTDEVWDEMKNDIKEKTKGHKAVTAIGSGGNINKVFSLSKRKDSKPLPLDLLRDYYKELSNVSLNDRIHTYNLRDDRADVIVPALQIYVNVMRWAGASEIYVPKIGLADGLVQHLWEEVKGRV